MKGGLLFLLHHMNGGLDKILLAVSVGWYAAAILLNLTFLYPKALILRLVTLCVLTGIAAMSYLLIYRLVKSCRNETQLQEIAYTDHLTGLRNRGRTVFGRQYPYGEENSLFPGFYGSEPF